MSVDTLAGIPVESELLRNYCESLVNRFFKILPMRESEEASLCAYIRSLQIELIGFNTFFVDSSKNIMVVTLLSTLQYLFDNPSCDVKEVKREVFKSISICNKMKNRYMGGDSNK